MTLSTRKILILFSLCIVLLFGTKVFFPEKKNILVSNFFDDGTFILLTSLLYVAYVQNLHLIFLIALILFCNGSHASKIKELVVFSLIFSHAYFYVQEKTLKYGVYALVLFSTALCFTTLMRVYYTCLLLLCLALLYSLKDRSNLLYGHT